MSDLMRKLELLGGLPIFFCGPEWETVKSFGTFLDQESPFLHTPVLVKTLIEKSQRQDTPVIYKDENKIYFACMKTHGGFYLTGPACMEEMSYVEIHRYYKTYSIPGTDEKHPVKLSPMKFLTFVSLLYEILEQVSIDTETLMIENDLADEKSQLTEKEDALMELRKIEDEVYHHTYQEERYVMDCVREGDTVHVMERINALMESAGTLSSKKLNHLRNLAIVCVTAATREAIAGGVSPAEAYRLSDLFINQIDRCSQADQLVEYSRKSVYEFARLVSKTRKRRMTSNYTEQCKEYIHQNYHRRILLDDIAQAIGVSSGYLSRVFHRDTGISLQDYIQKFRVERAANLLKYSEASLSEISDYVCFHSQSHFGSVFKKYMHMTPGQYRDRYKRMEFISK
ncbi:MAG: AraC family transcriptional regulator [Eubacteriales bacterium]|nr:AraC family transcriptional regulator [Eubacteriales bacterium]